MSEQSSLCDVAIVGAGPAGSAAAIQLARRGYRVMVFEQAKFPRNKVCGGCLSGDAVESLEGLLGGAVRLLGTPVGRVHFEIGRRTVSVAARGHCRIVPRDVLDAALADGACAAGATLRFGSAARLANTEVGPFELVVDGETFRPRWILWAAGAGALPQQFKTSKNCDHRRMVGQAWSVTPNKFCPPTGDISMHWFRGGYVGMAALSAERCLVALAVQSERLAGRRPREAIRAANPDSELLQNATMAPTSDAIGSAGFPHRPSRVGFGNVLLIGDAAGFEEPFSGEGMGQAFRSAAAAVDAVVRNESYDVTLNQYARALAEHRKIRRRTRWLGAALRNPVTLALANAAVCLPMGLFQPLLARMHVKTNA